MAENKKLNPDEVEAIENAIAEELTKNDDIVEYIQPSSLEILKARYAAAEEDESIRNEGFELARKGGLIKKARPENTAFDYYSTAISPKDEIRTDVDSPLSQVFDTTKSEFDADTASFGDISFENDKKSTDSVLPIKTEADTSVTESTSTPTVNNRYGYDTHTRVIYFDESADDGIKRNSEDELSSAFLSDNNSKRRFGSWIKKKK